jgi:hypothetical protein
LFVPGDRRSRSSAAGRPVVIRETGFTKMLGAHRHSLIAFRSLGEIADIARRQFFEEIEEMLLEIGRFSL